MAVKCQAKKHGAEEHELLVQVARLALPAAWSKIGDSSRSELRHAVDETHVILILQGLQKFCSGNRDETDTLTITNKGVNCKGDDVVCHKRAWACTTPAEVKGHLESYCEEPRWE
eukprot:1160797-Pelagomonas_calceolata.AAC.5